MTETPPDTGTPTDAPEAAPRATGNATVTEVMKAAGLPTPGGGTGGAIGIVYGSRAPAVWATKGWAAAAGSKPNIASQNIVTTMQKMNNATLSGGVNADVVDYVKTVGTWEDKGWTKATTPALQESADAPAEQPAQQPAQQPADAPTG